MARLLIVEDDIPIASMYEFKLSQHNYQVKVAGNGVEGLEIAKQFLPDIILLDLKMPVMSGEEMLEKLRAEKWGSEIKIIILTNISKDESPSHLRFLNVDRYIVKAHHTPSQIVKIVNEVMRIPFKVK